MAALESDLTLVSTVATELGIVPSDEKLPRYVAAASESIRRYLGRVRLHYAASYVDKVAAFGRPRLVLELTPIISVASVVLYDGTVVTDFTIEDAENGFLYRDSSWPYTGNLRPGLLYSDVDAGTERRNITATYAGGWVTPAQALASGGSLARSLPYDLEEACVQTCVGLHRRGGIDPNVASESLGDYSVSFRAVSSAVGGIIPDSAVSILDRYKRLL
jgi:hypothetical protein